MPVMFHQSIRHLFFWVLVITISLFLQTMVYAAQVTLAWDPNNPAPDGYRVYARIEGQTYDYASPVWPQSGDDPTQTTCTIDNLAEGTSYYFVVRAYVGDEESGDSNEVNHITAEAQATAYTITTNAGANGSISPASATVNAGDSQTFTITPNTGYHVEDVLVDGVSVGAVTTYTFSALDAGHTIAASFAVDTFAIQASAGSGGAISPSGAVSVPYGGSRTFAITPDSGYHVEDVLVDGVSVGAVTTYTFSAVDAGHTIAASFVVDTFAIQASAGSGGAISPSGAVSVSYGGSRTFAITPDSGYHVEDVLVDGVSVGAVTTYTFSAVDAGHTIAASFVVDTFAIQASAGSGGTISPSGAVSVSYGGSRTFAITPDSGYHVEDVLVDGVSVGAVTTYTFSAVDAGHTIAASFAVDAYTIDASAGLGGFIAPSGSITISSGSSHSFIIGADDGYEIDDIIVDGTSVGALDSYDFLQVNADHTIEALFKPINQLPKADAGPDQVVDEQTMVTLSGLNSTDLDDGIAAFKWIQIKGSAVNLNSASEEMASFVAPNVGTNGEALEFELTVTDFSGAQAADRCIVNVTWVNEPPVANAGADQSVDEGSTVVLNAADSMDPDDGIATYEWRQIQGPDVVLSSPSSTSPSFTTPDVGPQGASLVFQLTVTDAGGLQDTDDCTVVVTWDNMEPVADAGPDQQAALGDDVILNGSNSMDPDGLELEYQWRQTFGIPVVLSDATSVSPHFSIPMDASLEGAVLTFELTVKDSGGLQGVDSCQVTVQSAEQPEDTTPPTVTIENPSDDFTFVFSRRITITGSAHDDREVEKVVWQNSTGDSGEAQGTTQWRVENLKLSRGYNTITITAFDGAGNQQSQHIKVFSLSWGQR